MTWPFHEGNSVVALIEVWSAAMALPSAPETPNSLAVLAGPEGRSKLVTALTILVSAVCSSMAVLDR